MHRRGGYGPDYVNLFVKHHKEKMRESARQHGICNPIDVGLNKWRLERRMTLEEERARKEAKGGDKSTDAGLERPCCCIVCQ